MEKIDEGKDKKHTGKLTDNREDGTYKLYYISEVTRAARWAALACGYVQ